MIYILQKFKPMDKYIVKVAEQLALSLGRFWSAMQRWYTYNIICYNTGTSTFPYIYGYNLYRANIYVYILYI